MNTQVLDLGVIDDGEEKEVVNNVHLPCWAKVIFLFNFT